jgi:hypothetical protein
MVKFDATAEVEFHADKSACGSSDEIDVEESKKCMW